MNRPEITKMLSEHLERHIKAYDTRVYWAKEDYAMQKDRKGRRAARRRKCGYDNRITGGGEAHCKQY
jgi:hypothetical protein|nr:MAG TPA: hypothetical protein [Caudoviricetes sp.]